MRNLKRVLSLTLASVMLLGMMVIGSSAAEATKIDFADADQIENTEAVDVMVALGVLEGSGKNFLPKEVLTREQAAKIICYMLLGPEQAENLTANSDVFKDVAADRWSAGYIAYCAERKILSGVGGGNFAPTGELTGVAFGKMLLVALGYDPSVEGYTGSGWALAVGADMVDAGIAPKGVLLSAPMTREQAAQAAFQTLEATMVQYRFTGLALDTRFYEVENTSADYTTATTTDGKEDTQQFCEKYFADLKKAGDWDDFQRPGHTWKIKTADITFVADEPIATFTSKFSKKDLYNAVGNSVVKDLNKTTGASVQRYYLNSKSSSDGVTGVYDNTSKTATFDIKSLNSTDERVKTANDLGDYGLLTEIYVDSNNNVDVVMVETYVGKVSGNYNSTREQLTVVLENNKGTKTLSSDDFANLDSFADKDWVLVTMIGTTVKSIAPAETITGNVSSYAKNTRDTRVTVDGTPYNYSKNVSDAKEVGNGDIGKDILMVMDPYGYVIALDDVTGDTNYIYITKFGTAGSTLEGSEQAKAYFGDGTNAVITINEINGKGVQSVASGGSSITNKDSNTFYPGWYTYSETSSGKYDITPVTNTSDDKKPKAVANSAASTATVSAAQYTSNNEVTKHGSATIRYASGQVLAGTSSTVFYVDDGSDVNYYVGVSNVPTIKAATDSDTKVWAVKDTKGYATYVYINTAKANVDDAASDSSDIIFILGSDVSTSMADGNYLYSYEALINGSTEDMATATKSGLLNTRGLYRAIKKNGAGNITDAIRVTDDTDKDRKAWSVTNGSMSASGNSLTITGGSVPFLHLVPGANIYLIQSQTNVTDIENAGELASRFDATTSSRMTGVIYAVIKDEMVTDLFVDVTSTSSILSDASIGDDAIDNALADHGQVTITNTLGEDVTLRRGTTTLNSGASLNGKTMTVDPGATVEIGATVPASGEIALNGGKLVISADSNTLPAITGNGTVEITDGKTAGTNTGRGDTTALTALGNVSSTLTGTPDANAGTTTVSFPVNAASGVKFAVTATNILGYWDPNVKLADLAARTGGGANSTLVFVELNLSAFDANDVVNVKYKTSADGAEQEYGGDSYGNWTLSAGEAAGTDTIIIPVTSDVVSIIVEKVVSPS